MDIFGTLNQLFWGTFPLSLALIFAVIVVIYMLMKGRGDIIGNRVEVFFKGYTKSYYRCIPEGKNAIKFVIKGVEYIEPIISHPRIEYVNGKLCRTYLYAEGIGGTIDVPPLTPEDREKIVEYLVQTNVIKGKAKKSNLSDYTDDDLLKYIHFYNFDIEQVLDKPMPKAFTTSMNAFEQTVGNIIEDIKSLEGGASNKFTVAVFLVAFMVGFFMAYALSLKQMI